MPKIKNPFTKKPPEKDPHDPMPSMEALESVKVDQMRKALEAVGMSKSMSPIGPENCVQQFRMDYLKEYEPDWLKCYFTVWVALAWANTARSNSDA